MTAEAVSAAAFNPSGIFAYTPLLLFQRLASKYPLAGLRQVLDWPIGRY
jgi:hypothetical protein